MKTCVSGIMKIISGMPLVVGTISTKTAFLKAEHIKKSLCDVLEVRLDKIGCNTVNWLEKCQQIEWQGIPVIVTIRSRDEGGEWGGSESLRELMLKQAIDTISSVDIELNSKLCNSLCSYARNKCKMVIVSAHDFARTPSSRCLYLMMKHMLNYPNAIPKIACMIRNNNDIFRLLDLLSLNKARPKCILGMGEEGIKTRILFPALGASLTYGYIGSKCAPGQIESSKIKEILSIIMPHCRKKM